MARRFQGCLTGFIIRLICTPSTHGEHGVHGPSQPIIALAGEDVILPCYMDPTVNAERMTVEWTRPDLKPEYIHVLQEGRLALYSQNPSYRGRTALFPPELKKGNISLKLSSVRVFDQGKYTCFVPLLNNQRKNAIVHLIVGVVHGPDLSIITAESSRVTLYCESHGWPLDPEMSWLDSDGKILIAGATKTVKGPDGLYTLNSTATVEKTETNRFTCRVQQQEMNRMKERHISVPGNLFVSGKPVQQYCCPLAIGSFGLLALFVGVLYCFRNKILGSIRGVNSQSEPLLDPSSLYDEIQNLCNQVNALKKNNLELTDQLAAKDTELTQLRDTGRGSKQRPTRVHWHDHTTNTRSSVLDHDFPEVSPSHRSPKREMKQKKRHQMKKCSLSAPNLQLSASANVYDTLKND
ncbi:butyrophilin subfamily 1 member A1-like isoform X2 [Lampris incognitus]|uniref:butyrophilin subfamily 1 member A1-like isoform X2 n=1 Tax=Lampris incognitus TaxID=2546036 RepID=UPI0024B57FC7|nr:butyrophilin subfamily 1 member A1-like isoform X2 [Lampris incognitus]